MLNEYAKYAGENAWVIGTVSIFVLYLINWHRRPKQLPPGPRGIPIVGYLPFMRKRPEMTAYELSKRYGKILTIQMGLGIDDVVFLNDFESINKVSNFSLITDFIIFNPFFLRKE